MLGLTQSIDPQNLGGIPWATSGIAIRGAMTTIVGPHAIGSLYAAALTVQAAARGLRVGTVLGRTHPTAHGLQIGGAIQAAQLDDEARSGIKTLLFHHDALATGFALDNAEDLQRFEAMLRCAVDIAVIDNTADLLGPPSTSAAVVQRVARIVRTSDASLVAICRAGSEHEAALRDYSALVLRLEAGESEVRVVCEKASGLATPGPLVLRLSIERLAVCTGGEEEIPALQWIAPPKPSATRRLGDIPPSRANQPAT